MGCFFGCFRVKYDNRSHSHLVSDAVPSKKRDALISGNKLGSLLQSEEKEFSPCKDTGCHTPGSREVRELRDEAKFLKACGTLLETPAEIRKASEKVKDSPTSDGVSEPSRLHSWLPSSSVKKLHWEEQPDQASTSPAKLCEDLRGELGSPEHEPSSCMPKGDMVEKNCINEGSNFESLDTEITNPVCATDHDNFSSVTPEALAIHMQSRNKSVRFECEYPSNDKSLKQSDVSGSHNGSNRSPYPTPLRLTDEMQTPGTIYPVSLENHANGKNARIRSQYVYPVLNPVENFSQWKVLKEEDSYTYQQIGQTIESFEKSGHATSQCTSISFSSESEMQHEGAATVHEDMKLDASLAHWLKPSSSKIDRNQNNGAGSISSGKFPKMSDEDRPIIGMVAAHWNDDGISHVSPKWWDGNGIPNSTTKYKEDQRVSWHATPFEERLEKALSEESNVYQRKLSSGGPIIFEENEETDTAVSRLHTSAQPESVVSF